MNFPENKFVVLENRQTGEHTIVENAPEIDFNLFDACIYADTRLQCYSLMLFLKPAKIA
jgi:hypothetical protein